MSLGGAGMAWRWPSSRAQRAPKDPAMRTDRSNQAWHNPAPRLARCCIAAVLALGLAAPGARAAELDLKPSLGLALPDENAHYLRCLDAARRTPQAGLAAAEDWGRAGGGFPAEHCQAVALFVLKRYAEAAQGFEALAGKMMQRSPALRAGALEQAGQAWLLANRPDAARAAFDAALSFTPDDPDLLIDRARAHGEAQDFVDAIADLDAALKLAPRRADALVYRASSYRQQGELKRARADIDAALKRAPDFPEGLLERANIRRLQGDDRGARADWRKIEKLAPGSPAALAAKDNLAPPGN